MILDVTTQIKTVKKMNRIGGFGGRVIDIIAASVAVNLEGGTADVVVWKVGVEVEETEEVRQILYRRSCGGGFFETSWMTEEIRRELDKTTFHFTAAGHRFWEPVLAEGRVQTRVRTRVIKVRKEVRTNFLVARQAATEEQLTAERRKWETDFSEFVF